MIKNILVNNLHLKFKEMFPWVISSNFIEIGPQIFEIASFSAMHNMSRRGVHFFMVLVFLYIVHRN